MNILNQSFSVGQRYRGDVDGEVYTVINVLPVGTVIASPYSSDYDYTLKEAQVHFRHEKTGAICKVRLEHAKRLQLTRVPPKTI